jgi:predicted AlkP superfamily pyrophosphatase or phosphodiesterase
VNSKRIYTLAMLFYLVLPITNSAALDQIAIVFIVDQLSHNALQKVAPYTTGGIRELLDKGVVYENAHYMYAGTQTGPGHATLNTGTFPKIHGITNNSWFNKAGEKIICDYDTPENAAVLSLNTLNVHGKSARNLATDGISDQIMMESVQNNKNCVISLSYKSRAAIFTASKLGKAIWFDAGTGNFTSSKAYYDELPLWVTRFNTKKNLSNVKSVMWKPYYSLNNKAYSMAKNNYDFARLPSMINKKIDHATLKRHKQKKDHSYNFLVYDPQSNKMLLELAQLCLEETLQEKPNKILLWISLSSLDKVGHIFGPDSLEYIDTIYHIDYYLKNFMDYVRNKIPESKITFAFTADHGSTPIIELLDKKKFTLAKRTIASTLQQKMNDLIEEKYGIQECVRKIYTPSIFLNHEKITRNDKYKILHDLKRFLKAQPGIKNAWTYKELKKQNPQPNDFIAYYKNQLFYGRTGSLIFQTDPYSFITSHPQGSEHASCYNYTTHVPLIFYQPGKTVHKNITKSVSMAQCAPTLASKLSVVRPSACLESALHS